MKLFMRKNRKSPNKDNKVIDSSSVNENVDILKKSDGELANSKNSKEADGNLLNASVGLVNGSEVTPEEIEPGLINKALPRELLLRIFSYLDVIGITRCAQVSKYWNSLALDGSNWQYVDLFNFQKDVSVFVVENIAQRCNDFLKAIRLENCRFLTDEAIK